MFCVPKQTAVFATVLLATATMVGCTESSSPLSGSSAFGANASSVDTSSTSEGSGEENSEEAAAPEGIPDVGTKIAAFNNFEFEPFSITEQTVVYIYVSNPSAHQFDAWLVDEVQLDSYRDAVAALPASALSTHQNYQADYGIDLAQSLGENIYVNFDLPAGDYSILIDNTDLGDNETFNDEAVDYQFSVYVNGSDLIASDSDD